MAHQWLSRDSIGVRSRRPERRCSIQRCDDATSGGAGAGAGDLGEMPGRRHPVTDEPQPVASIHRRAVAPCGAWFIDGAGCVPDPGPALPLQPAAPRRAAPQLPDGSPLEPRPNRRRPTPTSTTGYTKKPDRHHRPSSPHARDPSERGGLRTVPALRCRPRSTRPLRSRAAPRSHHRSTPTRRALRECAGRGAPAGVARRPRSD
jgi:hypothetical protein